MPAGPGTLALPIFGGIKFVGYSGAANLLKRAYRQASRSVVKLGLARTAVGIVAGLL